MFFLNMMTFIIKNCHFALLFASLTMLIGCSSGGIKSMSLRTSNGLPDQSEPTMMSEGEDNNSEKLTMHQEPDHSDSACSENKQKKKTASYDEQEGSSSKMNKAEKQDEDLRELLK